MKLSVIIVNYNVKYFLEQCLHSVVHAIDDLKLEVLVVDNASSDDSLDYLKPLFPSVQFIGSKENLGFGKANNLAAAQAKGEYVLFLNPDTIVPEDCFTSCINFFEQHPKAGALGVRMLDGSGKFLPESKRAFPSTSTAFFKAIGLSERFPKSKTINRYSLGYLDETKDHLVDVLAGAFMMVRRSVIQQIGGFDEQFFMYGEDIDLSYRIKQAGFENWYFAGSPIIHFKGESLKKWSADHVKVFYEAMIVFVKRHYHGSGAGVLKLFLISGIRAKSVISLIKGSISGKKLEKSQAAKNVAVVGSEKDFEDCRKIYLNNQISFYLFSCDHSLLQKFCISHQIEQIFFSSSTINYKDAISFMMQFGTDYTYRFYASNSNSIVGSDSKSSKGEALATR